MIYIVTLVFNRKRITQNYLRALAKQTTDAFKVIIVDDGSIDDTSEMTRNELPEVILLNWILD